MMRRLGYSSLADGKSGQLSVQATSAALKNPTEEWHQVELKGGGPKIVKLSVWALGDRLRPYSSKKDLLLTIGRVAIIMIPLQPRLFVWPAILLRKAGVINTTLPFSSNDRSTYPELPSDSQDYHPKYARNPLDANPSASAAVFSNGATYDISRQLDRRLVPRLLMTKEDNIWKPSPGTPQPYIVISYTTEHFKTNTAEHGLVEELAEKMATQAGVEAY